MLKIPKNSKILKNDGHFSIPHPQVSLKQFSNIFENVVYSFCYKGVGKMIKAFHKTIKFEKIKNGQFSFFLHFATTTHCNFKSWKTDPPYCIVKTDHTRETRHIEKHRETDKAKMRCWQSENNVW